MPGSLVQLVAYGAQDVYLTGSPMITFFKVIYRRHTNFCTESIEQQFNYTPNFGTQVSAIITRNGDLINRVYLETTIPALSVGDNTLAHRWTDNIGHYLLSQISIDIGGQTIDTHYADWFEIWAQLTVPAEQQQGYYQMIGQGQYGPLGLPTGLQNSPYDSPTAAQTIYIPLRFWFCRDVGLSLPLIALQFHEVKLNFTFAPATNLIRTASTLGVISASLTNTSLWVDYIFLDNEERRRYTTMAHEYLIDQLQYNYASITASATRAGATTQSIPLTFYHPLKELIWVVQPDNYAAGFDNQLANYTAVIAPSPVAPAGLNQISNLGPSGLAAVTSLAILSSFNQNCVNPPGALNPVVTANLTLNGRLRMATRPGSYYNWVQPYLYHTGIPISPGINVYSFGLYPERYQPAGSCNFSRIDHASLNLAVATYQSNSDASEYPGVYNTTTYAGSACTVKIFALNYNVLRIMAGMGGLAYTN